MMNFEKYEIPDRIKYSLTMYVEIGQPTGDFLKSVLTNDLFGAFGRADQENKRNIETLVRFIYNEMPAGCFGSKEHYDEWIKHKGLKGL